MPSIFDISPFAVPVAASFLAVCTHRFLTFLFGYIIGVGQITSFSLKVRDVSVRVWRKVVQSCVVVFLLNLSAIGDGVCIVIEGKYLEKNKDEIWFKGRGDRRNKVVEILCLKWYDLCRCIIEMDYTDTLVSYIFA